MRDPSRLLLRHANGGEVEIVLPMNMPLAAETMRALADLGYEFPEGQELVPDSVRRRYREGA